MARRRLFGAAAAAVAKSRAKRARRSSRRSSPAPKRRATRRAVRMIAAPVTRRRRRGASGAGVVDFLARAAFVAAGVMGADALANRLPSLSEGKRAAAIGGAGFGLALLSAPVSRTVRGVPFARRIVTPGTVALLGLGIGANAARRAWPLLGGPGLIARFLPGDGAAPAALPAGGTVAARPTMGSRREMAQRVGALIAARTSSVTR